MRCSPNIHVLHAHDHIVIVVEKRSVKGDDIIRVTPMHNLQFSNNPLSHLFLGLDVNDLFGRLVEAHLEFD